MTLKHSNIGKSVICIAVTGAAGSGRTFTALNLAAAAAITLKNVLLIDMNDPPGNCCEQAGLGAAAQGTAMPFGTLFRNQYGIDILRRKKPETKISQDEIEHAVRTFIGLFSAYDAVFIDCRNKIRKIDRSFISLAPKLVMVTDGDPENIKSVYMQTKALTMEHIRSNISLVVNRVDNVRQGTEIAEKLDAAAVKFLDRRYELLTAVPHTTIKFNPVFGPRPLVSADVNNPAAKKLIAAVRTLLQRRDVFLRLYGPDISRVGRILVGTPH